ncbi:MAG TPA: hypothetical protein VLA68_01990, partial [Nitrososphaera sp.]|nr:hypothetical protein [Nitrososphaera sp.]
LDLKSNSTISDFMLEEENKRVTFKVDGENGTIGVTEIPIGRILEGPYTVTIDGQATSNFEVTPAGASQEAVMRISYTHSVHDVSIAGTNVVPEFSSLAFLVLGTAVVLSIVISSTLNKRHIHR